MASRCVVIGDDAAALAIARRLTLDGHQVVLWQTPHAAAEVPTRADEPRVTFGAAEDGEVVTLAGATTDAFEALAAGDVLVARAPARGLAAVADQVLPLIEPRHVLVLLGGGLHALAAAKWLRDHGRGDLPTLVASDAAAPAEPLSRAGFGVFPARRTGAAMVALADLFPQAKAHTNVLAAALATVEPMLRAALLFMNLGAAQRPRGTFLPFEDGFTQGVARVAEALDGERLDVAAAVGLELPPAAEALHIRGLSPLGDLWSAVNGSLALTTSLAGGASQTELLAADVAFCMRPWAGLADQLAVPAPLTRSLMALCEVALGDGLRDAGWSVEDLGIGGMNGNTLQRFLASGDPAT